MSADQKHTEEPWVVKNGSIYSGTRLIAAVCFEPNAHRIVAYRNALKGLKPSAVPGLVEAGQTLYDSIQAIWVDTPETELSLDLGRRVLIARGVWSTALAAAKIKEVCAEEAMTYPDTDKIEGE